MVPFSGQKKSPPKILVTRSSPAVELIMDFEVPCCWDPGAEKCRLIILVVTGILGPHPIYGCQPKNRWKTLQIIHWNRLFHYKPSILGYPYFWETSILWICLDLFCILGFLGAIWDPYDARQTQIAGDGLVGECKPEQWKKPGVVWVILGGPPSQ